MQATVNAEVAHDEIHASIPREITGDDAIPPALTLLQTRTRELFELSAPLVAENGDRHPLADNDQIDFAIAGDILP